MNLVLIFGECDVGYKSVKFLDDSVFLVTGGAGFIGSNICEALLNAGYTVRCLDNLSTGNKKNIEPFLLNPKFSFIEGDIRNLDTCLYSTEGVDYVSHQAAWGSVPRSIEMPILYEEINIKGSLNMMDAARTQGVKKFVYASSSSVYGDHPVLPKKEGVEGRILSPYALTKKVNEYYADLYSRLYGLSTIGFRYFNVFGKRQDPHGYYAAVIPKFVKALMNNEPPVINGDGTQSRDFTYIENVVEANLKGMSAPPSVSGEVFNIAFGAQADLNSLYNLLSGLLNKSIPPLYGPERGGDIKHSNADISKARKLLGYDPDWSLEMGLQHAVKWYQENL